MSNHIELNGWDEFEKQFKPIKNHFRNDPNEKQFETYGEELDFVNAQDPRYVWTWVDGDMCSVLVNGKAFVNRLVYYVCEIPWEEDKDYTVLLSVEEECECYNEDGYENGEYGKEDCTECEGYGYVTKYID